MARMLIQTAVQLYYKIFFRARIVGLDNIPQSGPIIFAANHVSSHDPVVLAAFLDSRIRFMAKQELFAVPILGRIVKLCGAFPVNRKGIGIGAIREAIRLLECGEALGIFPEGTRNRQGRLIDFKSGIGFIAVRVEDVHVIPVAIQFQRTKFLRRCHIAVGEPILVQASGHQDYRMLSQRVMQTVYEIKSSLDVKEEIPASRPAHLS